MQKIYPLSSEMISRIAAGEVIERPAYAVKELVENSIDAHSAWIRVEIEESGLKKIAVLDDGEGMSYQDLKECFKPHSTSKIRDDDHLIGIKTLGFRGEALSSIASISTMTIQTKTADQATGHEVVIQNGVLRRDAPVGIPKGTKVIVEELFSPVPARKKFLKSNSTEWRLILEIVTNVALANLSIRFSLTHNKKKIFDLAQNQSLEQRVKSLLGESLYQELVPVNFEESFIKITGYVGLPHIALSSQNKQFVFVNSRRVNDRLVSTAVKEAFGTLLPNLYYPVFLLDLRLPFEMVDVNIHPRKEQLSFLPSQQVFDAIQNGVYQTLMQNNLIALSQPTKVAMTSSYTGLILKDSVDTWNIFSDELDENNEIIQLNHLYLVLSTKQGLRIYDQHACHERILYEQFTQEFKKHLKTVIDLKNPVTINLSVLERESLFQNLQIFQKLGFNLEEVIPGHIQVFKIPAMFQDRDISSLLKELLEHLEQEKGLKSVDYYSNEIIKYLACKTAIKAGDKLNSQQAKRLLKQLDQTPNKATCPHGRPTNILSPTWELDKRFKR